MKKKKNTLKNPKQTNWGGGGGGAEWKKEKEEKKATEREREGAEEMNPKLQEAYAFLNELALGLDLRP